VSNIASHDRQRQKYGFGLFGSKLGFKFPENTTALSCNILQHPAAPCSTIQNTHLDADFQVAGALMAGII